MADESLRVASVGLGRWAQVIATATARSDKIQLVNCYSRSSGNRASFAEAYGCRQAESYQELLADDQVEAVLITTPNPAHAETIIQAAEAGKHVWVEKPIAHIMADARRIREALEKTGVTFAVGHSARMLGASRKMKEMIANGDLGEVTLVEANWSNERALELTPDNYRYYAKNTPGGPLIQLLVHHFDTLQYLIGPIAEVQAYTRRLVTSAEVDDVAALVAEFEGGQIGYFGSSWVSPGIYWMNIFGSKANLYHELDFAYWKDPEVDKHTTLHYHSHESPARVPVEVSVKDMFRDELEDFVDAIRTDQDPEVGWHEASRALAAVEAAVISSRERRPVRIEEVMV